MTGSYIYEIYMEYVALICMLVERFVKVVFSQCELEKPAPGSSHKACYCIQYQYYQPQDIRLTSISVLK